MLTSVDTQGHGHHLRRLSRNLTNTPKQSYQWEEKQSHYQLKREGMREHIPAPLEEMTRKVPVNVAVYQVLTDSGDSLSNILPLSTLHQFFYCWDNAA